MISDLQWENKLTEKLQELAETDELAAELEIDALKAKRAMDGIAEAHFLVEDGNIDERWAKAKKHNDFKEAEKYFFACELEYKKLRNKRISASDAVSGIQSIMRNRRQGPVT